MRINITTDQVKALYNKHKYPISEGINVFGIRNKLWIPDDFNDTIGILWDNKVLAFSGTTKPGKHWLISDDGNKDGVFILQPGYYENCWHKGMHNGKYKALKQFGNIFKGWRDNDLDGKFDPEGKTWTNVVGLNLHTTKWVKNDNRVVGQFSAGCQVVEVASEYDKMMVDVIYKADQSIFSYALFNEE
jgi:hypothetical protein